MTTMITVDTHLHPVEAQRVEPETGQAILGPEIVPPGSKRVFYVSSVAGLSLRELPAPPRPLSVTAPDSLVEEAA